MHNQYNSFNEVQAKKHDMDPLRPCHAPLCSNNPLQIFSLPQLIKSWFKRLWRRREKNKRERRVVIPRHTNIQCHVSHSHMYILMLNLDSQCCLGRVWHDSRRLFWKVREQMVSVTFHSVKICPRERQREWFIWFIWLAVQCVKDIGFVKSITQRHFSYVPLTQKAKRLRRRGRESKSLLLILDNMAIDISACWVDAVIGLYFFLF